MTFQLSDDLWPPQRSGLLETLAYLETGSSCCLWAPTGGGKTRCAAELIHWCDVMGYRSVFYLNRRFLLGQTYRAFRMQGINPGVRAAGYDDLLDLDLQHQISSEPTERARVYKSKEWDLHEADLVIVDEAHLQKSDSMMRVINEHRESNQAQVVLLTATPIELNHITQNVVISGTLAEYRECKALVPAMVKSIEQPDLRKVKRNQTGEYILDGRKKKIYTQSIVGNVIDRWKRYNPDARPTALYAPGVSESRWLTQQFRDKGIAWAHVDATDCVIDGKQTKLNRELWDELFQRWQSGNIKGISSRFKLREGIDMPELYYCILATPIGSLCSYLQTIGRILRYSEATPDAVCIQDHGGNYHRHGSPNHDRPWDEWWNLSEHAVSSQFNDTIKQREKPEPIRCPKCEMERMYGSKCPDCGFEHKKSARMVIQENGSMREMEGELIKPRITRSYNDTQNKWSRMYWGFRKHTERTFNQLEAWFFHEHHYYPPRSLDHMPMNSSDWYRKVSDVELDRIRWPNKQVPSRTSMAAR